MSLFALSQGDSRTTARTEWLSGLIWSLTLGVLLFVYTNIGAERYAPPKIFYIQIGVGLLLSGWWIWKVWRRERLARSPLALPLVVQLGAMTLATLYSIDQRRSWDGLLGAMVLVLIFFVLCDLLLSGWSPEIFVNALLTLATLILLQACLSIADWYRHWWALRVSGYPPFLIPYRIFWVAEWPTQLAALLNMALPFVILKLVRQRRPLVRVAWVTWLLAYTVALFFTRSRGGWLAAALVVVIVIGWRLAGDQSGSVGDRLRRGWRPILAVGVCLLLFALVAAFDGRLSPSDFNTNGGSIASGASRPAFWGVAWKGFLASPLTGSGPLTYDRLYADQIANARSYIPEHAHNLFLDVLAQQGLLGMLALLWVLLTGGWALLRAWRSPESPALDDAPRRTMLGVCAALTVFVVQSQIDLVIWVPFNALIVIGLCAVGMHVAGVLQRDRGPVRRWQFGTLALLVALPLILVRQHEGSAASRAADLAIYAGDWTLAATLLDSAVASEPRDILLEWNHSYVYGALAAPLDGPGDQKRIQTALAMYDAMIERGPAYVPNMLNAALLHQTAGDSARADALLAEAVTHGEDWALPALLLAEQRGAQEDTADMERLFAIAAVREPQAAEMSFCRSHADCRTSLADRPTDDITLADRRVRAWLAEGQPQTALDALRVVPLTSSDARPWLGRAAAHLELGQLAEADYALNVAEAMGAATRPATASRIVTIRARLLVARQQPDEAISVLQAAIVPGTLLPRLEVLQQTELDLEAHRLLRELAAQRGLSLPPSVMDRERVLAALLEAD